MEGLPTTRPEWPRSRRRPIETRTVALNLALQHVLNQQIPADESRENVILCLLRSGSQSLSGLRVVALVHRSPLVNIGEHQPSQNTSQLRRFAVEAVALEGEEVEVV
jgi:hypothetical protein